MKYLFIDGGFLDRLHEKSKQYFEIDDLVEINYRSLNRGYGRVFYYDAYPAKKARQSADEYNDIIAEKNAHFARINNTPHFHTREGVTRNRTGRVARLEQKGVDVLLAIDVYKHAIGGNIEEAHIMVTDLDYFPLLEALRDTRVAVHLHCYPTETAEDLMFLADKVHVVNPLLMLNWCDNAYFQMHRPQQTELLDDLSHLNLVATGECSGNPLTLFKGEQDGEEAFFVQHANQLWWHRKQETLIMGMEFIRGDRIFLDE